MFGDGPLTFREFMMREPLLLSTIHNAVLEFLRGRDDAVLFGAQAVNAYIKEPRMTQEVDIASPHAENLAEELRNFLNQKFHIAVRVRTVRGGIGYRISQIQKPENRHLVDVRPIDALPPYQRVQGVLVVTPAQLICEKVLNMVGRRKKRKGLMDEADLHALLLTFPELKTADGPVRERLVAAEASGEELAAWSELVAQEILPEDDADEFQGLIK